MCPSSVTSNKWCNCNKYLDAHICHSLQQYHKWVLLNLSVALTTYPYEYFSFALHREIRDAMRPASRAVQSKNMWKESEIKPRLEKAEEIITIHDDSTQY